MTFADWLIATIVCLLLSLTPRYRFYVRSLFSLKKPFSLREMLRIGLPMGGMYCIETGYFFVMTILMGWIGVGTLAANQVAMQYLGALTSVVFSTAQAITIRMGHLLGSNELKEAERAAYAGISLSFAFMLGIAFLYWFIPNMLISVDFNEDNPHNFETVHLAALFLFISAFFQIFESVRLSLVGALRALKDTHYTFITSIISFWCLALPLGYLFSITFAFGGAAFWWAMVAGALFSLLLLYRRFKLKIKHL